MKLIDAHTHLQFRGKDEYKQLVARGYEAAITCSFLPITPRGPDTVLDSFDMLLKRYCGNVGGLKIYVALGIHPRSIPKRDYEHALRELPAYLKKDNVVALGEVGLETSEGAEEDVLLKQLEIARDTGSKVILHTPRENKAAVFEKELALIKRSRINPPQVLVDHCDKTIMDAVVSGGFQIGLSVGKGKITAQEAAELIKGHEDTLHRMVLNTDLGFSSDYLFDLPDAASFLEKELGPSLTTMVAYDNAKTFFGV